MKIFHRVDLSKEQTEVLNKVGAKNRMVSVSDIKRKMQEDPNFDFKKYVEDLKRPK